MDCRRQPRLTSPALEVSDVSAEHLAPLKLITERAGFGGTRMRSLMLSHASNPDLKPYFVAAEDLRKNKGQWAAYEARGHCVVLAGPDSGKTKVLTVKLARLIAEDVAPPRGVACLTYNNECVRELTRRLARLGIRNSRNVFVGTVHSFCLKAVLLPYAKLGGLGLPDPLTTGSKSRIGFWNGSSRSTQVWNSIRP